MYDHKAVDPKWQARWEAEKTFAAKTGEGEKFYTLVEFPFPSGAGLHVGHPRSYTALDVVSRKSRMQGKNVLFPMGWDAFGLPTENYALKTGIKPAIVTEQNTDTFRRQLKSIGFSFDWDREVNTTDPKYYKWTQWMFLEFFKAGLAYKATTTINWCPKDKIGLANEEAVGGVCDRCGGPVEKREKEQWMIAITKYADRLLEDLKGVNYLPKIKKQQEDWIGRSEGAEIDFAIDGSAEKLKVFTTRPDTLFGVTYMVMAPEHPLVSSIVTDAQRADVFAYVDAAKKKTDEERGDESKEKTGVFTGAYAVNPANGEKVPIWVADYVLWGYGTGAIMAVPAHDERDHAFALKYDLAIKLVVQPTEDIASIGVQVLDVMQQNASAIASGAQSVIATTASAEVSLYTGDGLMVNSGFLNGLSTDAALERMTAWLAEKGVGQKKITYKLRDWVFSRQRYWGEPIPLVHCESGCNAEHDGWVPLPVEELPLVLPDVEKYEPTDNGESPLAAITDWVNTKCPQCGGAAKRETDTMPNWAGSSWYFLRYVDAHNDNEFASREALKYWMPVDLYNGGMEHTTLHLLYSRFWYKFLFDRGYIPEECGSEPYARRHSHGLIMAEDGQKMSKSKGNVVNPDDIVQEYGADTLRVYELFMGPFEEAVPWSTNGVVGVRRFLDRVARLADMVSDSESDKLTRLSHKTLQKVADDIDGFRFNTAVAQMMIFVNGVYEEGRVTRATLERFLHTLSPFAPHIADEVWEKLGNADVLDRRPWPTVDVGMTIDTEVNVAVQFNGKTRGAVTAPADADEAAVIALAKANPEIMKYWTGEPKKIVHVKNRILNIVL